LKRKSFGSIKIERKRRRRVFQDSFQNIEEILSSKASQSFSRISDVIGVFSKEFDIPLKKPNTDPLMETAYSISNFDCDPIFQKD